VFDPLAVSIPNTQEKALQTQSTADDEMLGRTGEEIMDLVMDLAVYSQYTVVESFINVKTFTASASVVVCAGAWFRGTFARLNFDGPKNKIPYLEAQLERQTEYWRNHGGSKARPQESDGKCSWQGPVGYRARDWVSGT
jgi:hypothetical protein